MNSVIASLPGMFGVSDNWGDANPRLDRMAMQSRQCCLESQAKANLRNTWDV
jgi:hypothetical protein